jgi:diguanylate cyclase (GGDEF)-like protein
LFRTGGEEFMLLLSGVRPEDGVKVAEGLRRQIESADILGGERLTISVGGAAQRPGESLTDWSTRADAALYQAKREGRNRVVFAD